MCGSFQIKGLFLILSSLPFLLTSCGGGGSGIESEFLSDSVVVKDEVSLKTALEKAKAGDVVSLNGATIPLSETLEITKMITLKGPGILQITNYMAALKLSADGIKVSGITIQNPQMLKFEKVGNCSGRSGPENISVGIYVNASNIEISDSTLDHLVAGIQTLDNGSPRSSLKITGNKFQKMLTTGYDWCGGPSISSVFSRTIISNNSFSLEDNATLQGSRAIWIGGGASDTEVSDNTIDGIYFDAINLNSGSSRHLIRGNIINGSGIVVSNSAEATVSGNQVTLLSYKSKDLGNANDPSVRSAVRVFNAPGIDINNNQLIMGFTTSRTAASNEIREAISTNGAVNAVIRNNSIKYPSNVNRIKDLIRAGIAFWSSSDGFLLDGNSMDTNIAFRGITMGLFAKTGGTIRLNQISGIQYGIYITNGGLTSQQIQALMALPSTAFTVSGNVKVEACLSGGASQSYFRSADSDAFFNWNYGDQSVSTINQGC